MKTQKLNAAHVWKQSAGGHAPDRVGMNSARPSRGRAHTMQGNEVDAKHVWKQFEDVLAPRMRMPVIDRAVYSQLVRHSRLEGRLRVHFSIQWIAGNIGLSEGPVREAVRRLIDQKVLRLVERSKLGHVVEVRLPDEVPGARSGGIGTSGPGTQPGGVSLDGIDFFETKRLRQAIHARERGVCFYCLRRIKSRVQCLDHVVPRAESGRNSYRNLVSCCLECNSRKGQRPAGDYVRWLYREGKLKEGEFIGRLRALKALAAGKLRPDLSNLGGAVG